MAQKEKPEAYSLDDYPEAESVEFPKEVWVTFAVCGKDCGNKGFIVDGQTMLQLRYSYRFYYPLLAINS